MQVLVHLPGLYQLPSPIANAALLLVLLLTLDHREWYPKLMDIFEKKKRPL